MTASWVGCRLRHAAKRQFRRCTGSHCVASCLRGTALLATVLLPMALTGGGCGGDTDEPPPPDAALAVTPDASVPDAPPPDAPPPPMVIDIRADNNRNGVVDLEDETEDLDEDRWDATHGAIFLANLDDDAKRCKYESKLSDQQLAECFDAADEVINGDADLEDLARIKSVPWPDAPPDAFAVLDVSKSAADYVRLFRRTGDNFEVYNGERLTSDDLRQGVEFAIEGRDIVRDARIWDGFVDLTFSVELPQPQGVTEAEPQIETDQLRMRVAPALLSHHLQSAQTIYAAETSNSGSITHAFLKPFKTAVQAAGVPNGLAAIPVRDQWAQDYFETGYMTMPAPDGKQKVIRLFFRSANVYEPNSPARPLRFAGRFVFVARGPDVAAIQQFDLQHHIATKSQMTTLDSFGNTEVVPPHSHAGRDYPFGRIIRGSVPQFHPDPSFQRMLEDQSVQPMIKLDTSWLLVGHVDETLSFLPAADVPRGWVVLVGDPALAVKMLEQAKDDGHGDVQMFVDKTWIEGRGILTPAAVSIAEVLDDPEVMAATAEAAIEIAAQLETLELEIGITDKDLLPAPFLHEKMGGLSVAYQPGTVNGMLLSEKDFAAPDPHGPMINHEDIFKTHLTETLAPLNLTVHYVENWDLLHRQAGEVHCGSNALRAVPDDVRWWEVAQ